MNTVLIKAFPAPDWDRNEILRYAGVKADSSEFDELIENCIDEIRDKLTYKVCYAHFPVCISGNDIDLGFTCTKSEKLRKNLDGCKSFILFAATIGIEIDRMIAKYGKISPSKALIFQAIGAERIESLCDNFNKFIIQEYGYTKPRFSPGYGDLPLEIQKDFFRVLEPSRRIGLTLNESMLMTPSKSVTAIIGISDTQCENTNHNCNECNKKNCIYRR